MKRMIWRRNTKSRGLIEGGARLVRGLPSFRQKGPVRSATDAEGWLNTFRGFRAVSRVW